MMKLFRYILFGGVMLICGNVVGQITINVNSGSSTMCAGSSIGFGSVVTCNSTYQWHKNGVPIPSETNQGYSTNSLVNGDVITCVQVTTTLPCVKDTSNKITITILPTASITLSSAAVTANQTVCQNTAITQIKYAIIGATGATVNNLPTGVTGTYSNGFLIISGTPTQSSASPFNYTINTTGVICGSNATMGGSITVKDAPILQLEDVGNPFSPFNNCGNNSGIPSYTLTVGNISSNTSTVNNYNINWGDGNVESNILNSSFPKTHQYNSFGVFHLVLSTTNSLGCIVSWSKDVVNQTNPAVGIQGPPNGSTQGCAPVGYWFKLTNYSSNTAGTIYNWDFDDSTSLSWTTPLIVDSVFHIFNTSSCNKPTKQFTVSVNAINQCTSTPATIGNIKIFKKPKAKFNVSDSVVCLNTTITFTNNSDLSFNGNDCNTNTLYTWNFGDPASGSLNVSTTKDASHTYQTSGQFIVILIAKGSCGNDTMTKTICVNPTPTASFTTPKDTLCAGDNLSFTSTSNIPLCSSNIYSWSVTPNNIGGCNAATAPIFVSPTSSSSANPVLNFSKPGTYVVSLTTSIQGTNCTSTAFSKTITVKDKPNVSVALSRSTICQGDTMTPIVTANCFANNATYSWTFQNGTPATSNIKNPTGIVFNTAGTNNISVVVTNSCGNTTQATSVDVKAFPLLTASPVNANICNGQNATINLSSNQAGIKYSWTSVVISGAASGNSNQPTAITTTSINNTLTNSGIVDAVVRYTITVIGATPTNCIGETKVVDITVKPGITAANAGIDQNLCNAATVTLAGNNPTVGTGTWTKISGPAATITNTSLNNTTVTGLQPGVYLFAWTIAGSGGGSCATSTDTVQIINRPTVTQANAGSDIIVCNFSASNNSVTLQGNTATPSRSYETGTWTVVSKPIGSIISFSNINSSTSTFTFNQTGNYTLAWTITNDINCTPTTDTVTIKVYQAAVGGTTSSSATVCKGNNAGTISLAGFTGNIVKWQYKVLGSATWVDIANTTSTLSYTNLDTTTSYQAIIATTNTTDCPITAASTITTITVNPVPSISNLTATSPTQCSTANGSISFNVVPASGNYTIAYTLNGGNQTANITTSNGIIIISNLGVGLYDNIKVTLNSCPSNLLGSITLSNPNKPATPVITAPSSICSGSTLNLSATTSSSGAATYNWVFKDGSTPTGATQSIPNITVAQGGVYHVTVTINQCTSNDTTINITVNQTPAIPTATARSYCQNEIASALTPSGNNYVWYNNVGLSNGSTTAPTPSTTTVGTTTYYVIDSNVTTGCKSTPANLLVTVNLTPIITLKDTLNPSQCQAANGFIKINGLPANTNFLISYKKNNGSLITLPTQQSDASGTVIISNLTAGTYSNIFVTTTLGCTSNTLPSVTLSDPTKPATPIVTGNTPICSGGTLNLGFSNTYTGIVTYNWSGPGTLSNGNTATPSISNIQIIAGGTYSLTVTIAGCTSDAGTKPIVVNQTPTAPTTSSVVYCQGATATALSASGINLIWYNNAALNNGSLTAPTPITTAVSTTTYYVVDSSNAGCKSNSSNIVVTVNATPVISNPVSTNPQQCQATNGKISFDVTPTTGTYIITYTKGGVSQSPITVSPSSGVLTIPNLGAGLYDNIKVTLNSCPSNTLGPITLVDPTPPATPVIIAPTNICSGKDLTFSASTTSIGTATYNWSGPNSFSATGASQTINNIATKSTGSYSVTVMINSCISASASTIITIDSTPVAPIISGVATVCSDSTLKLTASTTSPGAMIYNWTGPNSYINNIPTIVIASMQILNGGNYTVTATSSQSCKSASTTQLVTVNTTPIISNLLPTNPQQCQATNGKISFNVMPTTGSYTITYTNDVGAVQTLINVSPVSGVLTIPNLGAGSYDNIRVSLIACPSNKLGPISLVDPTPPATPIIIGVDSICSGKNLTLTAASPITNAIYTWTHPNGSSQNNISYTVNNVSSSDAGSYKLYVTLNLCKSKDTSFNVRVDSTPVVPTVTTNSPVCTDSTIKLFITNTYPMMVSYTWNGMIGFTSSQQNPTISNATMAMAGNYSAYVTSIIGGCQSSTSTKQVAINQTPNISFKDSMNPTQCATASGSITIKGLLSTTAYTVNYTFNGTPRTVSFSTNASGELKIDTLRAGTYSNINVILNNCPSNSIGSYTLVDPTPPATPIIVGVDSICSGKNLTLTAASPITNGIYTWTHPNGSSQNNISYTVNNISSSDAGSYKLYVILNLCKSKDTSFNVRVDSTPVVPTVTTNSPVCTDSTIKLFITNTYPMVVSYTWNGMIGFTSSQQNPTISNATMAMAGNYSAFVTSQIGACQSSTATKQVTINQTPNISFKDSINPTQCATASGSITIKGLLSTTAYTVNYTFNGTPRTVSFSTNASGELKIDTLRAGTYSNINVILNNCPSNSIGSYTLVDPNPPATPVIIGVDSICSGQNLVLTAASPITNAIYTWTKPNTVTTTGTSLTINSISVAESGIYKLYVTLNLCQSKDTNLLVRVDSTPVAPVIVTNSPVCSDSTIVLQASTVSPGSMNYSWTGANSFVSSLQNPTIPNAQLINAGSYSVFATSQIGNCVSATSNQNVVVNPSPNVAAMQDTTYKDGVPSGLIAFSGSIAATTFSWTNSNPSIGLSASGTGDISFTTSNTTPFPIFGIITVTPSTSFCTGKPITFKITVNPTPRLTSPLADTICTDNLFHYQATSSTPNVTYTWVRNAVAGISNPASASTDSSGLINETLINTTNQPINVPYLFKLYSLGSVNTETVTLTVNPDAKASYTFKNDKLCAPGIIDTANIKIQPFALANGSFEWYANGTLIGTGLQFPGYTIINNGDTVKIKLKANSLYGCKSDSFEHSFYNVKTPVASFTKSVANGCGPLSVNFTNTTTPLAYPTYKWDFGNGNTSTLQSPVNIIFREDTSNRRVDTTYYIKLTAYTECDSVSYSDSVTVFAPPKALFQPDTTVGCSIFKFRAFNNSWGQHNTYTWDFGDSTAIVIDTAYGYYYHNFYTAKTDTFNVKLTAANKCGIDSFEVKIVVFPNTIVPKLIVDGNSNFGCAPVQVRFVNNTIGANKFTIIFGDGSLPYISAKNPDTVYHTYQSGGNYTATLRAQNSCTDSTVALTLQLYNKPLANFSLNSSQFCRKETINFKNLSDSSLSFEWWFGDGGTSTNFNPTHRYLNAGNYTITLIAKSANPSGAICTDTLRKTITVHDLPVSSFNNNAAIQNCQPYYFVGTTILLAGEIGNWIFSDPFSNDTTQAGNVGVHTFNQIGFYQVKLVTFNVHGCTDTSSTIIKVIETPKAIFSISDTLSCIPGKTVVCTNQSTYTAGDAVNYQWYVNGVLQSTTKDFSYNFNVPLNSITATNFKIKLIAINSYGCRDSVTKSFVIYPKAQPAFAINANVGCVPFNLQFNNTTQYANIFNWYLDGQLFSTSAIPNPIVLSNPATTYNIKLVANHTLGCGADSVTKQFTTYTKPVANFLIPNKNSCSGILNIQCFDLSSVVDASITKWNWIFGDGATDTLKNPTHIYTTAGHFNVGLVATDNRGCKSDIVYQTVANFGKPKANFSIGNVCVRNPLIPINLSTPGLGSTAITNYLWNFGDGNYLTGSQPIYVYQNEGVYNITLIITSDSSCVADTLQKTVTVFGKPTADFKFENNCVNENTLFTNTSLTGFGQSLIGNSKWLFGDGGSSNNYNAAHIFNATGDYIVQLTVSGNRCPNLTDSIKKVVTVRKPRDPVIYPRIEGVRGTPIQLYALSGGVQYNWLPITGLDNAGKQNPIGNYTVAHPNIISYTITITDSLGCKVKDRQEVWLFADADIFVPTAFTPNGDGANDVLKPLYVNIAKINYFRIFDRWGKVVFETSDMGKAWDGTLNGNNLSMETYSWMIQAVTQQGKELIRKGNTTLIRN